MTSMPSVPPPHYSASTSSNPLTVSTAPLDTFFDIVPQADATSFQVGYLGLEGFQAWVKGDVLIKLDERARQQRHLYKHCSISLIAQEINQEQTIPFFTASQILWRNGASSSSASSSTSLSSDFAPSTLPFSFQLTNDLPHCIHLPLSSLEYRLEATLESSDESIVVSSTRKTLVHLTRYSRPEALDDSETAPHIWEIDTPTPMTIRLQRTLFRRAEPINVHICIPPPDRGLLSLSLRSAEANLYRVIRGKDGSEQQELLLAHSGKLCRFHSTRTIHLRLALHPPFDFSNMPYPHPDHDTALSGPIYGRGGGGGCESISQETLLHKVSFHVKITIGIRGEGGERRDAVLQKEIQVLPGAAGGLNIAKVAIPQSKKAEADQMAIEAGPSHSIPPLSNDDGEDEYDGYEDVGRPLSEEAIEECGQSSSLDDEDGPPPSLLESRNDLQVEVDMAGITESTSRSPPEVERGYVWRQEDTTSHQVDEDDLPPPPTPPVEEEQSSSTTDQRGPHRPPPYVADSLRTPRVTGVLPPAYPHPPLSPFVATPHPPSYEA